MTDKNDSESGDVIITIPTGKIKITGYAPTIWITSSFAQSWFDDAKKESNTLGKDARRREIIFSIAFAETYLLEFIRDKILNSDYSKLDDFFPPEDRRGVTEKWKEIPKDLLSKKYISNLPDLGQQYWVDWLKIVDHRNGLIHARASRPDSASIPVDTRPKPDSSTLSNMDPGRALTVTIKMITEFHKAVGITLPEWLNI